MSSISELIWFDGKYVKHSNAKIPVTTHAIHYGTSIFEGIRAYWNGKELSATSVKNDMYEAALGEKNHWEKHVPEPVAEIINRNWKIVEGFASSEDKTMRVLGMKFPREGYT